jgi:cysteinyl-tRNA synthetase
MAIVVYNTLTRRKEPFEPVRPGHVGIYLCGPTVYRPSHIGHAVGPIIFDAIKRYLVHRGYSVTWVVNVTDVEDKLIAEAAAHKTTTTELAERITRDYLDAMRKLRVDGIDIMPKASAHIGDIIAIIERLIAGGFAYVAGGDVYFDVSRFAEYGRLSNRSPEEQSGQRDLISGEKRHAGDFALWKAAKPDEPPDVRYDSPWGSGRPGWHIECSAMAMRYLGETFDIHGGGLDLVFPHHENEIAQSQCASGRPFAKYWMHNGLTRVNTKKISKSDTSPEMQEALARMTLHNLLARYPGELVRFLILSTHYRRPIEYSEEEIESKRKGLAVFHRLFERVTRTCGESPYAAAGTEHGSRSSGAHAAPGGALREAAETCTARFEQAMDDDFNTAGAIAALFEFAPLINRFIDEHKLESAPQPAEQVEALHAAAHLVRLGRLIGLFLEPPEPRAAGDDMTGRVMEVLIDVRRHLRGKKDFETADMIRNLLAQRGITLEDRPDGTGWRRTS